MSMIIAYTDGGSRGNPGPGALGIVIKIGSESKEYGKFLGEATNNEAEYQAVVFAFKKIKHLTGKEKAKKEDVEIRSDSELLISQLNGKYKIKEKDLIPFFIEIWNLKQDFKSVKFTHIPREENESADRMVNRELDHQQSTLL